MEEMNIDTDNFKLVKPKKKEIVKNSASNHPKKESKLGKTHVKVYSETKDNLRKIFIPSHRYSSLKENWIQLYTPIVKQLQLQVRFNLETRNVEIKTCEETKDINNLQKAADFVKAFVFGFNIEDALALLRLDDLFIETFEICDVKTLRGDHQSRAIGRLAGKGGRTKFTIENATKTRIVLDDSKIYILGSFQNIQLARHALCSLILGSPASKVFGQLKNSTSKISESM